MHEYLIFLQIRLLQAVAPQDQLTTIGQIAAMAEKYGLSFIGFIVFGIVIGGFLRDYKTGKLVSREFYNLVSEERDEYHNQLLEQININRQQSDAFNKLTWEVLYPLRDTLQNLKKEDISPPNNSEGSR